ncbi:sensor histidine kinase [Krasilnikovia sp. M28-CT-15]|uniref:sensor histidine kinase n=1 Tax=Krasilnikovia sp. M28-CT-15 TaxID=3373540 RepID=UPI00399D1051
MSGGGGEHDRTPTVVSPAGTASARAAARRAGRSLRILAIGPEPTGPTPRRRWQNLSWAVAFVLALILLGNLGSDLEVPLVLVLGLSVLIALPCAIVLTRPLMAWRIAWVTAFGTAMLPLGDPGSPWPWHPVQPLVLAGVFLLSGTRVQRSVLIGLWVSAVVPVTLLVGRSAVPGTVLLLTVFAVAGDQIRARREVQGALAREEQRSEQEKARRAVLEERARIAREMHDLVAHHMSLIAVRAETAPYRRRGSSPEVHDEFAQIATAAREGLTEMRRLLGVLRSDTPEPDRSPQPSMADLDDLVAEAVRSGMDVELLLDPGPAPVAATVGLSVYRIVQECLSNARRHAPAARVRIAVRGGHDDLELRVVNDRSEGAPVDPVPGAGHGVVGMRERAETLGGRLSAGPTAEGGYEVRAVLPRANGD